MIAEENSAQAVVHLRVQLDCLYAVVFFKFIKVQSQGTLIKTLSCHATRDIVSPFTRPSSATACKSSIKC